MGKDGFVILDLWWVIWICGRFRWICGCYLRAVTDQPLAKAEMGLWFGGNGFEGSEFVIWVGVVLWINFR